MRTETYRDQKQRKKQWTTKYYTTNKQTILINLFTNSTFAFLPLGI